VLAAGVNGIGKQSEEFWTERGWVILSLPYPMAFPCADSDHYWITSSISFGGDDAPLSSLVSSRRARYGDKADWPASFPWHGYVEQQTYISNAAVPRAQIHLDPDL
jgi:hypothetical protein